jgi:RHS repeat-associated protein
VIDPASTIANNLRFPGQYYDSETGLHYNYFRYYLPQSGRYMRPDPAGMREGTNHLYVYVSNAPLKYPDPLGLCKWSGAFTLNTFGGPVFGGGFAMLAIQSQCCNDKVAAGVYLIPLGGITIGPLPLQAVGQLVQLDGPEPPSDQHPSGWFAYISAGVPSELGQVTLS